MEDRCVMCGEIIPEGRQVCLICDKKIYGNGTGGQKMANKLYRFLSCLPGSIYRTIKYAQTIPFWRWF